LNAGARRAEILETAAGLFASSGYRTSLREIAEASGILPGSLYHHFESKEALVVELVDRYRSDLDGVARSGLDALQQPQRAPAGDLILRLGEEIAACAVRNRAAMLLTLYEPPPSVGSQRDGWRLQSPRAIESTMLETLRAGREDGEIRAGIDLPAFADRLCQAFLHIGLGVFPEDDASLIPKVRGAILLCGVAADGVAPDAELDRSPAFTVANRTIAEWNQIAEEEDERLPVLRAVARAEFGLRGYEATTVRHIAAAAGMSTGSVYRLIGSKDELLSSIMQAFNDTVQSAWQRVVEAGSSCVETLDALAWINTNIVDRYTDEYNIQLAWLRESPPSSADLGPGFASRMDELATVVERGIERGEIRLDAPSADIRAWSLFELLWTPESIVRSVGTDGARRLLRETVLRGAANR
jgi:AcrR family transcriptional regulator